MSAIMQRFRSPFFEQHPEHGSDQGDCRLSLREVSQRVGPVVFLQPAVLLPGAPLQRQKIPLRPGRESCPWANLRRQRQALLHHQRLPLGFCSWETRLLLQEHFRPLLLGSYPSVSRLRGRGPLLHQPLRGFYPAVTRRLQGLSSQPAFLQQERLSPQRAPPAVWVEEHPQRSGIRDQYRTIRYRPGRQTRPGHDSSCSLYVLDRSNWQNVAVRPCRRPPQPTCLSIHALTALLVQ
jgi:hypothetical protein